MWCVYGRGLSWMQFDPTTGVRSAEVEREEGRTRHWCYGVSNVIVQHMLRKRLSADVFHPTTSSNSTFFSHARVPPPSLSFRFRLNSASYIKMASQPLFGCVVKCISPMHERKTYQLGNKVIERFALKVFKKSQLQCRVMISLEGKTVQSMTS